MITLAPACGRGKEGSLMRHPSNARSAISLKEFQNGYRIQAMALYKIPSATDIPLVYPRPAIWLK